MPGIYIHIPFCRQSCIYCNFYFKTGKKQSDILFQALNREVEMKLDRVTGDIETIYFGGGTPSFVEAFQIENLLNLIRQKTGKNDFREITLEANPDDMNEENLSAWKAMGISRLSVGVQSFFDDHLRWMNRAHTAKEAEKALENASKSGFELSLDLIFGIPGESNEQWVENIEKACSFKIDHLSCYGLTLEENTPWKKLIERKKADLPDETAASEQFKIAMNLLKSKGWEHYEISNYCMPGKEAIHNTSYWQGKPYIGIGPSAHSYDGIKRYWNVSDLHAYTESIGRGEIPEESETLSPENRHNEYLMTGLRTGRGISLEKLNSYVAADSGRDKIILKYLEQDLLLKDGDNLRLSDEGKLYADAIASELFA